MIRKLNQIEDLVLGKAAKKIAVVAAHDSHVLSSVKDVYSKGYASPILIGDKDSILKIADSVKLDVTGIEIIHQPDDNSSVNSAVDMVKNHGADAIMKGKIPTGDLMRAIVHKENGFRTSSIISQVMVAEASCYSKLMLITDAAINIAPDLAQKAQLIQNAVRVAHLLGIETPKVAVLAAVETVNTSMPCTVEAAALSKMCERGQITGCIVDGPLSLDLAVSVESAQHKGIQSEVAGDADILLAPNIETGNILYKSLMSLQNSNMCAVIVGTKCPVIVTSRSDTAEAKYYSILLSLAAC